MSPAQVDAQVAEKALNMSHPDAEHEYRIEKDEFIAVVQPHAERFSFFVRDMRRERPTIHGYGVDFPHAVVAVTQLLNALTREP